MTHWRIGGHRSTPTHRFFAKYPGFSIYHAIIKIESTRVFGKLFYKQRQEMEIFIYSATITKDRDIFNRYISSQLVRAKNSKRNIIYMKHVKHIYTHTTMEYERFQSCTIALLRVKVFRGRSWVKRDASIFSRN